VVWVGKNLTEKSVISSIYDARKMSASSVVQ